MILELGVWDLEQQLRGLQRGRHYAWECDIAPAVCASVNGVCLEKIELDYEKRKKERKRSSDASQCLWHVCCFQQSWA